MDDASPLSSTGARTSAPKSKWILNVLPSKDVERDWRAVHALGAGILAASPPPPAIDLRDESWWPVGNQKRTGSCVGWATADSLLRWHFTKAGRIQPGEELSKRFIWMSAKETDEFIDEPTTFVDLAGTSLKAALDVARNYGVVREAVLPMNLNVLYQDEVETLYAEASQLKISSYFNLARDLGVWRRWIAEHGPLLVRLDVDDAFENGQQGVLQTYNPGVIYGGHAVSLVGYDPQGFIVRNSWGTTWGNGGYAHASNAYALAAFTETYGVTVA